MFRHIKHKKFFPVIITIFLVISSGMLITQNTKGYTVASVTVDVGAVNAIVNVTMSSPTHSITIYYDTTTIVDELDRHTLEYGGQTSSSISNDYGDVVYNIGTFLNNPRSVMVRGLTESTTYYYRIYDNTDHTWADGTLRSFTTLPRFTTEWVDKFYDYYLIESRNNMFIVQQSGKVQQTTFSFYNGILYPSVIYDGGYFRMYGTDARSGTGYRDRYYAMQSADGLTSWSTPVTIITSGIASNYASTVKDSDGYYKVYYRSGSEAMSYAKSGTWNSGFSLQSPSPLVSWSTNRGQSSSMGFWAMGYDQLHPCSMVLDTLGANKWIGTFQQNTHLDDTYPYTYGGCQNNYYNSKRRIGATIGITDTNFQAYNEVSDGSVNNSYGWKGTFTESPFIVDLHNRQSYLMPFFIDAGCYVGMEVIYNNVTTGLTPCGTPPSVDHSDGHGTPGGTLLPYLVTSRTFYDHWNNVDYNTPITQKCQSWETWNYIQPAWSVPITIGDHMYVYFYVANGDHYNWTSTKIGRLEYRKDGMTAIRPNASTGCWLQTKTIPKKFHGNMTVNGNFSSGFDASKTMTIAILNATTGIAFPGFESTQCTIAINSTTITPTWGSLKLNNTPYWDYKLLFSFTGTGSWLYAYSILNGTGEYSEPPIPPPPVDTNITMLSINWGGNLTSMTTKVPMFNWTIVPHAIYYELVIATDRNFVTIYRDIMFINSSGPYSAYYSANSTRVSFILPDTFILAPNRYYVYVRPYI